MTPCTRIFVPNFLLFFLLGTSNLNAMNQEGLDENYHNHTVKQKARPYKKNKMRISNRNLSGKSADFISLPEDIKKEILSYLKSNDFLLLRATSKYLKVEIDQNYWKNRSLTLRTNSSSPAIQEIKDIPCHAVSLRFKKWENKDFEHLFSFKHTTQLQLKDLHSRDFSTNEVFNPSLMFSFCSYLKSFIDYEDPSEVLFKNLTSLDLSGSQISSYGVKSFVSRFKNLKILKINKNDIGNKTEDDAKILATLTTLTSLDISYNEFSDESLKELSQLKNLTFLDVSHNYILNDRNIRALKQGLPNLTQFINNGQKQKHKSYTPISGAYAPSPLSALLHHSYGFPYIKG